MERILIVDDHAVVRHGLRLLLEKDTSVIVAGEAASGDEALQLFEKTPFDIVLMDVHMPGGLDGITTAKRMLQSAGHTRVIMLTMFDDEAHLARMLALPISGVVFKHDDPKDVFQAIHHGRPYAPYLPAGLNKADNGRHGQMLERMLQSPLSPREEEVLVLIAQGYANKEIAEMLYISVKTVETHRANIFKKLSLKSRVDLVQYAIKNGYLSMP